MNIEEEIAALKAKLAGLEAKVTNLSNKADEATDGVLAKVMKSSVSWLIVFGYSFGVFTLGAWLF